MSYPPHQPYPNGQSPDPEGNRPRWYSAPPREQQAPAPPVPPAPPAPGHAGQPGHHPAQPPGYYGAPAPAAQQAAKPYSPGLAGFGWVLTTLFGLAFIVLFFAGVSAFNSTADGANGARTVGAFIGFALILIIPAVPLYVGLRLIRQPKRVRPPR